MFTTYSASAGSGKTTHLVADYIALCFRSDSRNVHSVLESGQHNLGVFPKILAITFTNNAAAEMKDRIVQTLHEFAFTPKAELSGRGSAIYGIIVDKLFKNQKPDDEHLEAFMRSESLELLRSIIYDYARFTLTTIDSFFQRVIRSAALSLNLNLNYSVQVDLNEFYIQAIDQLLNELSADSQLATRLIFMLDNGMEDSGNLNVDRELKNVLEILYADAEKNYDYLNKLRLLDTEKFKDIIRGWRKDIATIPDKIVKEIQPIADIGNSWIQKLTFSFQKPTLGKWFDKVLEDPIKTYAESIDIFRKDDGGFFKKKELSDEEQALADEVMPHVIDCFNQIRDIQDKYRKKYLDSKILSKNANKLLLLFDLQEKMNDIKEQNNFFILSESNTLIYNNIKDKDIPEIFDQIKFDHYFIDEFQDTSQMQWRDMKPLITNRALSSGGQVTLFGDVKQAIYRFRNGDAYLFYNLIDYDRMRQDPDLQVDREHYVNELLRKNYRSSHSVIAFNNEFFEAYSESMALSDFYADVKQEIHSQEPGMVQVFIQKDKLPKTLARDLRKKDDALETYINETEDIDVEDAEVLRAVNDALARGYRYGDIAILYSGNGKCSRMANILLELGYPVVTEKSLVLNASPAVNLIIYTLKHLLHPNDLVAQTTILYYISKKKKCNTTLEEKLPLLTHGDFKALITELTGEPLPTHEWLAQPLFIMVKEIIKFYGLDAEKDPFVVDFENIVLNYLQSRNGELAKFLLWWQQLLDTDTMFTLTLPTDMDTIKVCTIHKSKGLEYPVVILPFSATSQKLRPVWTDIVDDHVAYVNLDNANCEGSSFEPLLESEVREKSIDTLNLLYVAHTRARDILYIVTQKKDSGDSYGTFLDEYIAANMLDGQGDKAITFTADSKDSTRVFTAGDPDWTNKAKPKELKVPITPNISTSEFVIDKIAALIDTDEQKSEQQQTGTFVHDFLSKQVDFPQSEEEVEMLLNNVEEEKRDRLRVAFLHILNDSELKPYFAPGVRTLNETTILDTDGNAYRPDRIVFLDDKVMVLDYKTGQPYPKYQQQIDQYCALLQKMGYEQVEGRLLYV